MILEVLSQKISQSLKGIRLYYLRVFHSISNLAGVSTALQPKRLANFKAMQTVNTQSHVFYKILNKGCYRKLKRGSVCIDDTNCVCKASCVQWCVCRHYRFLQKKQRRVSNVCKSLMRIVCVRTMSRDLSLLIMFENISHGHNTVTSHGRRGISINR